MDDAQIGVYSAPSDSALIQKWVDANPELTQIVNMREFHNLMISGNYALLQFEKELPADEESYHNLHMRAKQLLELTGGSYEKTPDKAVDEIKRLKDSEKK